MKRHLVIPPLRSKLEYWSVRLQNLRKQQTIIAGRTTRNVIVTTTPATKPSRNGPNTVGTVMVPIHSSLILLVTQPQAKARCPRATTNKARLLSEQGHTGPYCYIKRKFIWFFLVVVLAQEGETVSMFRGDAVFHNILSLDKNRKRDSVPTSAVSLEKQPVASPQGSRRDIEQSKERDSMMRKATAFALSGCPSPSTPPVALSAPGAISPRNADRAGLFFCMDNSWFNFFFFKPTYSGGKGLFHEGYLKKKGEHNPIWKRRWFVLKDYKVYYYEEQNRARLLGIIQLQDTMLVRISPPSSHVHQALNLWK